MGVKAPSGRQRQRCLDVSVLCRALSVGEVHRVLEVGPEHGWTGQALRDAFPDAVIDAVEKWEPYAVAQGAMTVPVNGLPLYDHVICADACAWLLDAIQRARRAPLYDVAVAADVIEHLYEPDARQLLKLLAASASLAVVTTPIGFLPQGEIEGNPYQSHRSGWRPSALRESGWVVPEPLVNTDHNYFVAYKRKRR